MTQRHIFQEFRDQLSPTRYPFADTATLVSTTGEQTLDHDTFLDAAIYPIGGTFGTRLTRVTVAVDEVTIFIGNTRTPYLASGGFNPLSPPDIIELRDQYGRPAGALVSDALRLSRFSAWGIGDHDFAPTATEFVASCVIPTPEPGLRGLVTAANDLFTGDVWIVGDDGVVVRDEEGDIRVDIVGDPLFSRILCGPLDLFDPPNFIRTINHCAPDARGNISLVVGDNLNPQTILRIYPTDAGLVIEAAGSPQRR